MPLTTPSQPYLTLNFNVEYDDIVDNYDSSYFVIAQGVFDNFQDVIGRVEVIRLLQIDIRAVNVTYNVIGNESPFRHLLYFNTAFQFFSLNGTFLTQPLTDVIYRPVVSSARDTNISYNFGRGLIVDNFDIPARLSDCEIWGIPPVGDDLQTVNIQYIIYYNKNGRLIGD